MLTLNWLWYQLRKRKQILPNLLFLVTVVILDGGRDRWTQFEGEHPRKNSGKVWSKLAQLFENIKMVRTNDYNDGQL